MSHQLPTSTVTFNLEACPGAIRHDLEAIMLGAPPGTIVASGPVRQRQGEQEAKHQEDRRAMSVLLSQWRDVYQSMVEAEPEGGLETAPIDIFPRSLRQRLEDLDRATAKGIPLP